MNQSDYTLLKAEIAAIMGLIDPTGVAAAIAAKANLDGSRLLSSELPLAIEQIYNLSPANDDFLQRKASAWANRTLAQVRTDIYANGQVAFPASQNASADANTLDDYEEGIWSPAFTFSTPPTGLTYNGTPTGRYTKIGRVVYIKCTVILTSKGTGGSGGLTITGLPFANGGDAAQLPVIQNLITLSGGYSFVVGQLSASTITIFQCGSNNAPAGIAWSAVADTSYLTLSGAYSV
jgi:hypothetical protein